MIRHRQYMIGDTFHLKNINAQFKISDCSALSFDSLSPLFICHLGRKRVRPVQWNHKWSRSDGSVWSKIIIHEVVVEQDSYEKFTQRRDDHIHFLHSKKVLLFEVRLPSLITLSCWSKLLLRRDGKLRVDMSDPLATDPHPSDRQQSCRFIKSLVFPKESFRLRPARLVEQTWVSQFKRKGLVTQRALRF